MKEKYFNNKKTIACFIIYILITLFIFAQSMMNAAISTGQSNFISSTISAVVDFFTKGDVNLHENGKDKDLYPETIEVDQVDTIAVGETITINAKLMPEKNYTLSKIAYSSSDRSIFTVTTKGVLTAVAPGTATLKVYDSFSNVSNEQTITVSPTEVYIPELTFTNLSGYSSQDNNVYFSTSNSTGAIYAIDFTTEVIPEKLALYYNASDVTAVLSNKRVYFYPKRSGFISFDVVSTFDNVNGKNQTHHYTYEVEVKETFLPAVTVPFSIDTQPVTITDTMVYDIQTNVSQFTSSNQDALGRVFYTYDADVVTIKKNGDVLNVKAKELGEKSCSINFYSSYNGELNKQTINFTIIPGIPTEIQMMAPSKWATVENNFYVSVVGDGRKYPSKDFIWTISGAEANMHDGGLVGPKKPGKITVTATHKTINNFTVSREFEVRIDFSVYIRKFIGHFSLFLVLALFAGVVYCRLAYIILPKKELLLGSGFAVVAGSLTSIISEILQSGLFVVGRAPSFSDVMLNIAGFVVGILIYHLIRYIIKRIQLKKQEIPA